MVLSRKRTDTLNCFPSNTATLYLHGNSFAGSIPDGLMRLTSLVDLRLSDNRLTGEISGDMIDLYRLGKTVSMPK